MSNTESLISSCPKLEISLDKIRHNTGVIVRMCRQSGIRVAGVTKGFCGDPAIARAMVDGGIDMLADSRIENLERLAGIPLPKILLRLPMISQVRQVVKCADISLNSEIETVRALSEAAQHLGKTHQVILMFDLGDLREGFYYEKEMVRAVEEVLKLERIHLAGIGTNLTCYGGVIPTRQNLERLVDLKSRIERAFRIALEVVSGGNSSSLYLVKEGKLPDGINQLRLGESILLGRETAFGRHIEGTYPDCFKLFAEIIEIKQKPSLPTGQLGMDAFGNSPSFTDKGTRRRAICAIGKQDVLPQDLAPEDEGISILGSSSDHLILDIAESSQEYHVGDPVSFRLAYAGVLSSMTSPYVRKCLI